MGKMKNVINIFMKYYLLFQITILMYRNNTLKNILHPNVKLKCCHQKYKSIVKYAIFFFNKLFYFAGNYVKKKF